MPKENENLVKRRKSEILEACGKLYERMGYQEITIRDISRETSMSRPSIYNYFETKEEIFLALLTEEYKKWTEDLETLLDSCKEISADELARRLADTLTPRIILLKISAMNLYEIETNSRFENLVDYKEAFKKSVTVFEKVLRKFIPGIPDDRVKEIRYAFFPFMYGIYPYVYPSKEQMRAMDQVKIPYERTTIADLTYHFFRQVLR
ncbi:MAG: TetR family transcriptional regulator [Lachnospiraceae bacterium]